MTAVYFTKHVRNDTSILLKAYCLQKTALSTKVASILSELLGYFRGE